MLVYGASGAVGTCAVQLAKRRSSAERPAIRLFRAGYASASRLPASASILSMSDVPNRVTSTPSTTT